MIGGKECLADYLRFLKLRQLPVELASEVEFRLNVITMHGSIFLKKVPKRLILMLSTCFEKALLMISATPDGD